MTTQRLPAPSADHNTDHLTDAQLKELLRRNTGSLPVWADARSRKLWAELGRDADNGGHVKHVLDCTSAAFSDTVTLIENDVAAAVKDKNWARAQHLIENLKALELAECLILSNMAS